MFILLLNEDLSIRAPLGKGRVASGCCYMGNTDFLTVPAVGWKLWSAAPALSRFRRAFSWEPCTGLTLTFTSTQLGGGIAHGDRVLHLLFQPFQVCHLTQPIWEKTEPSTGFVIARVSFHLLTCFPGTP